MILLLLGRWSTGLVGVVGGLASPVMIPIPCARIVEVRRVNLGIGAMSVGIWMKLSFVSSLDAAIGG